MKKLFLVLTCFLLFFGTANALEITIDDFTHTYGLTGDPWADNWTGEGEHSFSPNPATQSWSDSYGDFFSERAFEMFLVTGTGVVASGGGNLAISNNDGTESMLSITWSEFGIAKDISDDGDNTSLNIFVTSLDIGGVKISYSLMDLDGDVFELAPVFVTPDAGDPSLDFEEYFLFSDFTDANNGIGDDILDLKKIISIQAVFNTTISPATDFSFQFIASSNPSGVPEPTTFLLFGLGIICVAGQMRKRL